MGGGTYSTSARAMRSESLGYHTKPSHEIFQQRSINNAMNPHGVTVRESRDSEEHPESFAIVLGLDVTGSMGSVPHFLVKEGLPDIVSRIIQNGVQHPQILFLGIGDHECDRAPLQVGQFESSDELIDKWLTDIFLEGGGGGNAGESYLLAWYFAAYHTSIDCLEKRGRKGVLFTIGDEPVLQEVPARFLKQMMGNGQYEDFPAPILLAKAREKYNVFHILIKETAAGQRPETEAGWRQIMSENLLIAERKEDVSPIISKTVIDNYHPSFAASNDGNKPSEPEQEEEIL